MQEKKTGNKWFETQDQINYSDDFYKPKTHLIKQDIDIINVK